MSDATVNSFFDDTPPFGDTASAIAIPPARSLPLCRPYWAPRVLYA
jgi:hypothetical protein